MTPTQLKAGRAGLSLLSVWLAKIISPDGALGRKDHNPPLPTVYTKMHTHTQTQMWLLRSALQMSIIRGPRGRGVRVD